jgi:TonB family protein
MGNRIVGGAVFSRILWVAVISLLGWTAVFSQDAPKDADQPQNASSENAQTGASAPRPRTIRVGGNVAAANLIHQVAPEYPALARAAHISGTVLLRVFIGTDGTVENLQYVSGPPLLMEAAVDAVKKWQYKPTLLNGEPIHVETTVSVVFTLDINSSNSVDSKVSTAVPNSPPKMPPLAVLSETEPPYADSSDGMYKQFVALLAAWKSGDQHKFEIFRDNFALPDPEAWLVETFGAKQGAALLSGYKESLEKFNSHMAWVSGNWANAADLAVRVEPSELPQPAAESGPEAELPRPVVAPRVENFRFTVAGGEHELQSWVFSFVYFNGAFRIIGGTLTFWDEELQGLRAAQQHPVIVTAATLIHQVSPVYPKKAKKQHIEGTVLLHATITKDGAIGKLEYVSGPPELMNSAMDAVKKWRYKPTMVNGEPVEVDTKISVVFTLGNH